MKLHIKQHNNKLTDIGHFAIYTLYADLNKSKDKKILFSLLNNNKLNICLR